MVRDESGRVVEIKCTYDEATRAGVTPEGQKRVKGIVQWWTPPPRPPRPAARNRGARARAVRAE
jgi:hypothetical protein